MSAVHCTCTCCSLLNMVLAFGNPAGPAEGRRAESCPLCSPPTYPHLKPVCGRRKAAECAWCAAVGPGLQKCFSCSLALAAGQQVDLLSGFVDKWCVLAEISCTLTSLCLILSHQKAGKAASKCSTSDDDESQQNSSGKETGQLHR